MGDVRHVEGAACTEVGEGDLEGAVALQRLALPLEALVELRHDALVDAPLLREPAEEPLTLSHEAARAAHVLRLGHVLPLRLTQDGKALPTLLHTLAASTRETWNGGSLAARPSTRACAGQAESVAHRTRSSVGK